MDRVRSGRGDGEPDFVSWYGAEAKQVLVALRAALGDDSLAEEAVAEAFARAFARWSKVSEMDSPTGWVYRVALNHARSQMRRRRRELGHPELLDPLSTPGPEPEDPIWAAVARLSAASRMAIVLRYMADLPEPEIASLMGVSRGTVATTLHRTRKTLAEQLPTHREEQLS